MQMSYTGPGSIYSIGLHNIAVMCLLLSVASGISIAAFWGRIQGKLGDMGNSLAATLFKVRRVDVGGFLCHNGVHAVAVVVAAEG